MSKILALVAFCGLISGSGAFAATAGGSSIGPTSVSSEACAADVSGDPIWVQSSGGSLMMALRSNSKHFWLWSSRHAAEILPKSLLKAEGLVAGDAHHENFFYIFSSGKRAYVLNDFDDSGIAPFFLDFLKFHAVAVSVNDKKPLIKTKKMLEAYISGLSGGTWTNGVPRFLQDEEAMTPDQVRARYLEKIRELTSDGEFEPLEGLTRYEDLTSERKAEMDRLEVAYFKAAIPRGFVIRDRAMFIKGTKKPRYWYYVQKSSEERHILEFKNLEAPAVALFQAQKQTALERGRGVLDVYWPDDIPEGFGFAGEGVDTYWVRPKLPSKINLDTQTFREDPDAFAELTYFIAFRMGQWHARQKPGSSYAKTLQDHPSRLAAAVDEFTAAYLEDARARQKEKAKKATGG